MTSELQTTQGRLEALEAQVNEARLAESKGDPDKLAAYQRDHSVGQRERTVADKEKDLARREGLLKTDREELDKDRGVVSVAYIAAKHGLSVERLENLGISDLETLEKVAEEMKPAKPEEDEDADRQAYQALETDDEKAAFVKAHPDFESEALKLDSGDGSGSGERTEKERLDDRYPTMKKS